MCLCLFAINEHDEFPLILIANRDEFRKRPTSKATHWEDHPNVLAGRDLEGMGTWLGVNKQGKVAFLTNYRHPDYFNRKGPTRGILVSGFLTSSANAETYLKSIENPKAYNGFNLVVGTSSSLFYFANADGKMEKITNGIHGLSNAFLNTSWPKVDEGKLNLQRAIETNDLSHGNLFSILRDSSFAKDEELPNTGVGHKLEKMLSAKFINTPEYGTVCSTVIKIDRNGNCEFEERSFDAEGKEIVNVNHQLNFQ